MKPLELEKVKQTAALMDDAYWKALVDRLPGIERERRRLIAELEQTHTALLADQLNIIEAKYKGYQRLAQSMDPAVFTEIIRENKDLIGQLTAKKAQSAASMTELLNHLNALMNETEKLGESLVRSKLAENSEIGGGVRV